MINCTNPYASAASAPAKTPQVQGRTMDQLGQADFLRLLTVQVSQQDPFEPVDNKEMLAQMAQFSSLAGVAETNASLERIADKLDQLIVTSQSASDT